MVYEEDDDMEEELICYHILFADFWDFIFRRWSLIRRMAGKSSFSQSPSLSVIRRQGWNPNWRNNEEIRRLVEIFRVVWMNYGSPPVLFCRPWMWLRITGDTQQGFPIQRRLMWLCHGVLRHGPWGLRNNKGERRGILELNNWRRKAKEAFEKLSFSKVQRLNV